MDYKEKISLLENELSKIKISLTEIQTASKESYECLNLLRESFAKSKNESDIKVSKEKMKNILDIAQRVNAHDMEEMRFNSLLIRKISVEVSDSLDEVINYLEKENLELQKMLRKFLENLLEEENDVDKVDIKKIEVKFKKIQKESKRLKLIIRLCKYCIKGTIDKIKD